MDLEIGFSVGGAVVELSLFVLLRFTFIPLWLVLQLFRIFCRDVASSLSGQNPKNEE